MVGWFPHDKNPILYYLCVNRASASLYAGAFTFKVSTFTLLGQAQVNIKSLTILKIVLPDRNYLAFVD